MERDIVISWVRLTWDLIDITLFTAISIKASRKIVQVLYNTYSYSQKLFAYYLVRIGNVYIFYTLYTYYIYSTFLSRFKNDRFICSKIFYT